jgi:DNA-binding response OmpR family regulator
MTNTKKDSVEKAIRSLVALHLTVLAKVEENLAVLCKELDLEDPMTAASLNRLASHRANADANAGKPIVDQTTFCIVWQGKVCPLGNTLPFRFFAKISARPNRYFSHEELLDAVWEGALVTNSAIRGVAKRLRDQLQEADMGALADAIDGQNRGHYRFAFEYHG